MDIFYLWDDEVIHSADTCNLYSLEFVFPSDSGALLLWFLSLPTRTSSKSEGQQTFG